MVRFQICSFCQILKLHLCWQSSDFVGEISMLNLYIFLPGFLFFSLKDEILCVGNPWFSGPNTTFQSPKSTFSSRLKAFNARSLQRFSTCVLCNRFCVGYTKATMIHFTSLHWHKRESFLAAAFFLQVALLAKQALFCKSPCWRSKPSQDVNRHHGGAKAFHGAPWGQGLPLFSVSLPRSLGTPPIHLPYASHTPPIHPPHAQNIVFFPRFCQFWNPESPKYWDFPGLHKHRFSGLKTCPQIMVAEYFSRWMIRPKPNLSTKDSSISWCLLWKVQWYPASNILMYVQ